MTHCYNFHFNLYLNFESKGIFWFSIIFPMMNAIIYSWDALRRVKQEANERSRHPNFRGNWFRYFRSHTENGTFARVTKHQHVPSACRVSTSAFDTDFISEGSRLRFTFVSLLLSEFIIVIRFRVPEIRKCSFTRHRANLHYKVDKIRICNKINATKKNHIITRLNLRIMCTTE